MRMIAKQQKRQKCSTKVAWIYVSSYKNEVKIEKIIFLKIILSFLIKFLVQIRKIGDGTLKDVLKSLGGWPVTEKDWKIPEFSIEYLLGHLRGEYSEAVLIELYVGADDKNSSVHILQVGFFGVLSLSLSGFVNQIFFIFS